MPTVDLRPADEVLGMYKSVNVNRVKNGGDVGKARR